MGSSLNTPGPSLGGPHGILRPPIPQTFFRQGGHSPQPRIAFWRVWIPFLDGPILMQTRVGAGRDLVAEAPTQSSERQSGPGEGLPAAASWQGEAAVLSPRLMLPCRLALAFSGASGASQALRGRRWPQRSPTPFLQWATNCNVITQPSRAPRLAHHFLLLPAPWREASRLPGKDPRFCWLLKGMRKAQSLRRQETQAAASPIPPTPGPGEAQRSH